LSPSDLDDLVEETMIVVWRRIDSVRTALASLADDDREILLLNAWDGLDTHALGAYLVISTNAAAVRLSRAQHRFRELLNEAQVH
jgi:RNA polymerase sigma-70 factor (ECF subfamily)